MILDVSTFVGDYPYRRLPDTSPAFLLRQMDRVGIAQAWVGHLPSFLYRDPAAGTASLVQTLASFDRLHAVPTIHPGLPGWRRDVDLAREISAPAIRVYPIHQGIDPAGDTMKEAIVAAGSAGIAVILTVRFEDLRQRHPLDNTSDLPASAVRSLARADDRVRILVTHAGRAFVEEVHLGLTPEEAGRVLWDITWLWGPPYDELEALMTSVGPGRFVFGTAMPLRIPEAATAKLDLAGLSPEHRAGIESENLLRWIR